MEIYLYLDKGSFFHKLHPITKIISLLLLFLTAIIFNHPLYLLAIAGGVIFITISSRSLPNLYKIKTLLILLLLFCTVLWSIFLKGENLLWKFGPLSIYKESLYYAISMGIRLDIMLMCGIIFLSCTKIEEFTNGLNKLGIPFPISFTLSLAFRLVPTFTATTTTVIQAQKSRGLDLDKGSVFNRMRKHVPLIIPIFIYAVRNADMLAMALESKSFGAKTERTYYQKSKMKMSDYLTISLLIFLNAIFIYMRINRMGYIIDRI